MVTESKVNLCKICGEEFVSRNAVFRHLRSSKECYSRVQHGSTVVDGKFLQLEKRKVAIEFGYWLDFGPSICPSMYVNEVAAGIVSRSFFQAIRTLYPSSPVEEEDGNEDFTLASAARLRHPLLRQEKSCNAFSDVIGINYKSGLTTFDSNALVCKMQDFVSTDKNNKKRGGSVHIQVLNAENLMVSTKFNAEKSCSQRIYQYLMPIRWLDDSNETKDWICQKANFKIPEGNQIYTCKTPSSLVRFKKALRNAESRDPSKEASSVAVSSSGRRFGKLSQKERRPWHNFCDPSLGGMTNPSNENIWRSVDKARLSGFIEKNDEAFVVVEFRGDGFVEQQVRRIIASSLAISNGWLPSNFFDLATRSDVSIETPIAPLGLFYLSSTRFHFVDLVKGSTLFKIDDSDNMKSEDWLCSLHSHMLHDRAKEQENEKCWLSNLKHVTCPRIYSTFERITHDDENNCKKHNLHVRKKEETPKEDLLHEKVDVSTVPEVYQKTLSLLQDVCNEAKWPLTPDARSRVIRPVRGSKADSERFNARAPVSKFQGHLDQCGSFTVANPKSFVGKIPLVNSQFPELVNAIFELESHLSGDSFQCCLPAERSNRTASFSSSTHCTVNRNIEFTPHFDNGKGKEASYTTIVGLGSYCGGELIVDGKKYDICYKPLIFDGWKQIHSTEHFRGERFSLVWFTPERRSSPATIGRASFEDTKAKVLLEAHALSLNFRPNSTDALVINEILDIENCCYELSAGAWRNMVGHNNKKHEFQSGFSLRGHSTVLDIGAHIGVFCRYALSIGCKSVIAYEPESENLKLLEENVQCSASTKKVKIYKSAVAHGKPGMKTFVNARNRTDGSLNTWRHSLEEYSHYFDKKGTKSLSKGQKEKLTSSKVPSVPLFGHGGALVPGVSLVKMDCEGAELDILLSPEASNSSNWLDVKNLVFEWSFCKERRAHVFHKAVENLESAGFTVVYEGRGSWWDLEPTCMWPYHSDLIVFAMRQ